MNSPEPLAAPPRRRRRWLVGLRWSLGIGLGLILVAVGFLFVTGYPLGWVLRRAEAAANDQGLRLTVAEGRLKADFDGKLHLRCTTVAVGDNTRPRAIALREIDLTWSLTSLFGGSICPARLTLDGLELTPRLGPNGELLLIELPPTTEVESGPFTLASIPTYALPRENRPSLVELTDAVIQVPVGLPVASGRALRWEASTQIERKGTQLHITGDSFLRGAIPGTVAEKNRLDLSVDLASADVKLTVVSEADAGELSQLAGELPTLQRMEGNLTGTGKIEGNLEQPGRWRISGSARATGLVLETSGGAGTLQLDETVCRIEAKIEGGMEPENLTATLSIELKQAGEPLATVFTDLKLAVPSLIGSTHLKFVLPDPSRWRAVAADLGLPALVSQIEGETALGFSLNDRLVSQWTLHATGARGTLTMADAEPVFKTPAWSLDLHGDVDLGDRDLPDATVAGHLRVDLGEGKKPAVTAFEAHLVSTSGDLRLDLSSGAWRLDALREFVPGLSTLDAEGALEASAGAVINLRSGAIGPIQGALETNGLTAALPGVLSRRLEIAPFRIAASAEAGLTAGRLEPFALSAGPIKLRCEGIQWSNTDSGLAGSGAVVLGRLALAEALDWIDPARRGELPLTAEELAELAIKPLRLEIAVAGPKPEAATIRVRAAGGLELNRDGVDFEVEGGFDVASGKWEMTTTVSDFVAARWQLALLRRFPVPDIDAPIRLKVAARGGWPLHIDGLEWSVAAGQGMLRPRGALTEWLTGALPITRFEAGGRLGSELKEAAVDRLELVLGRASARFSRLALASDRPLNAWGEAPARVKLAFRLDDWQLADFLPLLAPKARALLPLDDGDADQLGIDELVFEVDASVGLSAGGGVTMLALAGDNRAVFRIGEERVPVAITLDFDPATNEIGATARLDGLRPDRLRMKFLETLPIAELPIAATIRLRAGIPQPGAAAAPSMGVDLGLTAGPGVVKAGTWLREDLPVRSLRVDFAARLDLLRMERFALQGDFDGLVVAVDNARLEFGEGGEVAGHLHGLVQHLDLAWVWRKISPTQWPEELRTQLAGLEIGGRIDRMETDAEFVIDPQRPGLEALRAFTLAVAGRDFRAALPGYPSGHCETLELAGSREELVLTLKDFGVDGLALETAKVAFDDPFGPKAQAKIEAIATGDFERIQTLLSSWKDRPADLDLGQWDGLAGQWQTTLAIAAPVRAEVRSQDLEGGLDFRVTKMQLPTAMRGGVTMSPFDLETKLALAEGRVKAEGGTRLNGLDALGVARGALGLSWKADSDFSGVTASLGADLTDLVLTVEPIVWTKPVGRKAHLNFSVAAPEILLTTPERTATFRFDGEGLVFGRIAGQGSVATRTDGVGVFGGLVQAEITRLTLDGSDLAIHAAPGSAGELAVKVKSERLDLAGIARRLEGLLATLNATAPVTTTSGGAKPSAVIPIAPTVTTTTTTEPDIDFRMVVGEIVLGGGHAFRDFTTTAAMRTGELRRAAMNFTAAGQPVVLRLEESSVRQPWSLDIADVGGLLAHATAPLGEVSETLRAPGSTIADLRDLPGYFLGGRLHLEGTAKLMGEAPDIDGRLRMDNLTLQKEIVFLSKIASLVDKKVMLLVPFKRFELEAFSASATQIKIGRGFIDGPINLGIEKVEADLTTEQLMMRGKTFGICFEVAGPMAAPRFYLCEKNPVLRGLTTEDEFVW